MPRDERAAAHAALAALVFLLVVTAAWWALALWPTSDTNPEWLARARWVCFNAAPDGLPDASGWLLLVGQPIGMLAVLMAIWGRSLRAGLRAQAAGWRGRATLAVCAGLLLLGLSAAGVRVVRASALPVAALPGDEMPPESYPRLDREAPELGLVDQRGERVALARLAGRPALVTFAFAHCETVCPLLVRQTLEAQRQALERAGPDLARVPQLVVVTLDPWRDTPSRLAWLAESWKLGADGFVLSGDVDEVNEVLDRWNVVRERDPRTGELVHPTLVYVLDPTGRIAYATSGGVATLLELAARAARPG
jgi:cytochrome oxidase Cu insertion factor (SCO1/SenC/PrrC family)